MIHPDRALALFSPKDICFDCKGLILRDHAIFRFETHPREHLGEDFPEEWQPHGTKAILGDTGPARVAYRWLCDDEHFGEAIVMVYEGDKDGLWLPCRATRLITKDCWFWICKPFGPKNPCDNDWLRSISS